MSENTVVDGVEIPTSAAADLTIRAASVGVSLSAFVGILALAGGYGREHPSVRAFFSRPKAGQSGPETKRDPE